MTNGKDLDSQTETPNEQAISPHQVQPIVRNEKTTPHKDTVREYEMNENMGIGGDLI